MCSQIIIITIIIAIIIAFIFIIMIILIMIMIMIMIMIISIIIIAFFCFFLSCSRPIKYQMRGSRKQTTVSLGGDGWVADVLLLMK